MSGDESRHVALFKVCYNLVDSILLEIWNAPIRSP